ncbi:hypothetical protein MLD38_032715 [Melastoma candidum]|uniref:Uncharacterized protein n=1 Tax=Melastoma candidum TaxID=119954 RepID=A0ACB9M8R3_9MYRT|nr:hypothetical protein MLD38_032715 [Melastoma candidum]
MSSTPGDVSGRGIVRRVTSLPRSILRGLSWGTRRRPDQVPLTADFPPMMNLQDHQGYPEEWAFLTHFERQYGSVHPFFYACRLTDAIRIAESEKKFLFVYLHSPEHPFTPVFCKGTLCSEVVVQFLYANFVSWGALVYTGEGLQTAATLKPQSYPFCAVMAASPGGDTTAVLQQIEGPISPAELIEILQRTIDEQGIAFGIAAARAKQEQKIKADRELREEQDAAYVAALHIDEEKERNRPLGTTYHHAGGDVSRKNPSSKQTAKPNKDSAVPMEDQKLTQILFRFPNGERRERSFQCTEKIQSLYKCVDSLGIHTISNYRLVSTFPRKVYGADTMEKTLKDAGLYPRATLFLEPF